MTPMPLKRITLALLALPLLFAATAARAVDVYGQLNVNTTWNSTGGPYHLTGDITVASGVTLTILAGTQISAASGDVQHAGTNTNAVELVVNSGGSLIINGTAQNPVTLTADSGASWVGIEVLSGGLASIAYANETSATTGIAMAASTTVSNSSFAASSTCATATAGTISFTNVNLSGCTGTAFAVSGGNATYTSGTITGAGAGLSFTGGSASASYLTISGGGTGVSISGVSPTLDHLTIANNSSNGVYAYFSQPNLNIAVTNTVITNNGGYGLYGQVDYAGALTCTSCDVWKNTDGLYGSVTAPGNVSANPLLTSALAPTTNSPLRMAGTGGSDIGAIAYTNAATDVSSGLLGTLYTNTTLTGAVTFAGDVAVAPGVTLTLSPGATISAASGDAMGAGVDTNNIELIVAGTLSAAGSSSSPITLGPKTSATWYGIRELTTGSVTLSNAAVDSGLTALDLSGSATLTSDTVSGGTCIAVKSGSTSINGLTAGPCTGSALAISGGSLTATHAAVTQAGAGLYITGGTASVSYSLFTGGGTGISISGVQPSTLDHLTIANNSSNGVYAYFSQPNLNITLTSSIIASNGGYGLYGQVDYAGAMTCTSCDVWQNTDGLYGSVTVPSNLNSNPDFVGSGNFHLQSNSPAIHAGASGSDIGAYPYSPGPLDHITLTPSPATVTAGGSIGFTAYAYDAQGNPLNATLTWSAASGAGTIDQNGTLTAGCTPGTIANAITATTTVNGVTKSASSNLTISAGGISQIAVTPATPSVSAGGTQTFHAAAQDACGNTVSGAIAWSVSSQSAGSINASTGVYTAPCAPGSFTNAVIATSGSVHGSTSVTVVAGAPTTLTISPPGTVTLPAGGTEQFTAAGSDTCGNVSSAGVTWSVINGGGTIDSSSGLFTAGSSSGTFTNTVKAASGSLAAEATVTVTAGNIASVTLSPSTVTLNQGVTQLFTAVAKDSSGNPVTTAFSWAVATAAAGSIDQSGNFTAGTVAGTYAGTIQATAGGVTGTSSVTVNPGAPASVTVVPASATLAPGGSTRFSAQVADANSNPIPSASVTWAVLTAAAGTIDQGGNFVAGAAAGTFSGAVQATAGTVHGTASVTISASALSQLLIAPATATVRAGQSVAFTASGLDASGNSVSVTPTWSVLQGGGSISSSGVFTAGTTPGTYADTVQATASGLAATATVIVTAGPPVAVAVTPDQPTLAPGGTVQFSAQATDAHGNPINDAVTWSADPRAGDITAGGLFTAGSGVGDYNAAVTATIDGISGSTGVKIEQGSGGGSGGSSGGSGGGAGGGSGGGSAGGSGGSGGSSGGGTGGGHGGGSGGGIANQDNPQSGGCAQFPESGLFSMLAFAWALQRRRR